MASPQTAVSELKGIRRDLQRSRAKRELTLEEKAVEYKAEIIKYEKNEEKLSDLRIQQAWRELDRVHDIFSKKSAALNDLNNLVSFIGDDSYKVPNIKSSVAFGDLGVDMNQSLENLKKDVGTIEADIIKLNGFLHDQQVRKAQLETLKEFYTTVPTTDIYGDDDKIDALDVSTSAFLSLNPEYLKSKDLTNMAHKMGKKYNIAPKLLTDADIAYQDVLLTRIETKQQRADAALVTELGSTINSKFQSEYNMVTANALELFERQELIDDSGNKIRTSEGMRDYVRNAIVSTQYKPLPTSNYYADPNKNAFPMARLLVPQSALMVLQQEKSVARKAIKKATKDEDKLAFHDEIMDIDGQMDRLASYGIDMYFTAVNPESPNRQKLTELGELLRTNYESLSHDRYTQDFYREAVQFSFGIDVAKVNKFIDKRFSTVNDYTADSHVKEIAKNFSDLRYNTDEIRLILNATSLDKKDPKYEHYMKLFKEQNIISNLKYDTLGGKVPILTKEHLNKFKEQKIFNQNTYNRELKRVNRKMNKFEFFAYTLSSLRSYYE